MRKKTGKSHIIDPEIRKQHLDYIRSQENEATLDFNFDFNDSDDKIEKGESEKEYELRGPDLKERMSRHINANLFEYILGLVLLIGGYFMIDSKVDTAVHESEIINIKQDVDGQNQKIDDLDDKISDIELETEINRREIEDIRVND
jgi:hypothetical protein